MTVVTITRAGRGWMASCPCGWEMYAQRRPHADKAKHDHERLHASRKKEQ